jgi:hypothetical protein
MFRSIRVLLDNFEAGDYSERCLGMVLALYTLDIQEGIITWKPTP